MDWISYICRCSVLRPRREEETSYSDVTRLYSQRIRWNENIKSFNYHDGVVRITDIRNGVVTWSPSFLGWRFCSDSLKLLDTESRGEGRVRMVCSCFNCYHKGSEKGCTYGAVFSLAEITTGDPWWQDKSCTALSLTPPLSLGPRP
jgi:hypothetical protein